VGKHEGYFQRWSVDTTKALKKGTNVIALKVSAPSLVFDMSQEYAVSWPKMQNQIKGIFGYHDTRPGATSWRGQERGTGGVLRGLALRESSGTDLTHVTVTPMDVSETSARLVIEATVHNWTASATTATFEGTIREANIPVKFTVNAAPGISRAKTEVTVPNPRLWWSWDYGKPSLYELSADLKSGSTTLDKKTVRFGIRSITRDEGWTMRLNGKRIYPRGTNYIATQWLSQADRAFYEKDMKLLVDANMNSIRVHAHLERPELYELADEMGILVWQDFPLQWGYTDMPSFAEEAQRQAEDMIRQYHDHPSIVVWCMHNEAPHAMTWMKKKDEKQNLALDDALTALAKRLDPSRIVHRDSGTGDGHYYYGWYDGKVGDLTKIETLPMVTEYGAASLPGTDTLRAMFDEGTLWPKTAQDWETWQFADFQPKITFSKIKQGKSIDEFVESSQRYQANLVRYTTEYFRRLKWTKNTGIYHFMFTDDWPAITWAVVDYYRRPKLAYGALRDSMQRLLPSFEYDVHDPRKPIAIHVISDHLTPFPGVKLVWQVESGGKRVSEGEKALEIPADVAMKVVELGVVPALAAGGRVEARIEDGAGKVLARSELRREHFIDER
jgi:beta-mannosidase